jgi:hypothetical protein
MITISFPVTIRNCCLIFIIPTLLTVYLALEEESRFKHIIGPLACKVGMLFENTSFCSLHKPREANKNSLRKVGKHEVGYFVEPIERWYQEDTEHELSLPNQADRLTGRASNSGANCMTTVLVL